MTSWLSKTTLQKLLDLEPKRAHVTPLFIALHWLPVAARIKFKTLMLVYRTPQAQHPCYFHSLITIYIPSRSLRSASERASPSWCHHRKAQNHSPERFHSPFLAGGMNFPPPIQNAEFLTSFKQHLETHLFLSSLDFILMFFFSLSLNLSLSG